MSLAPNQRLFEYQIKRVLGQGAFGVVYLAHDTLLDRSVAVKELTVTRQTDEMAFKRFLQEARAAGGLNSPHIVTVHALKVVGPEVYLVTEYLAGGSLRDLMEKRSPLPVKEAVRIAADVCEGLAAAHARGIIHRDIKPENILLTENGRAKVGDFGIAHVPRGAGGTSLTQVDSQPRTLLYMSPEQIQGQPVDGRSDVYQVGALLYEMLAGRHYVDFQALEQRARETAGSNVMLYQTRLYELLAEAICEQEPEDVCRVQTDVPVWIGEAVAVALAKELERRPAAKKLARMLRNGKAGRAAPVVSLGEVDVALAEEHLKRGVSYANQDRWDEATREFQAALRINPNYAQAHLGLGAAYGQQGRLDDEIREYQAALRLNPDYAGAHFGLGLTYVQQGRLDEAIREYQAALRVNPNYAEA
ncbi:MAG: serine/threonine-protein kinase, partial [Chloroflexota bacterium]|nr:serine/threonine-protein kinase [Chloroflexota bacterium]